MSFFDKLKSAVGAEKPADGKTYVFDSIPASLEELKARPEADLKDPDGVVALAVIAFNIYPVNADLSIAMLDFLKGPAPLSNMEKSFIKEQLRDKDYLPRSYFNGATPANNYEPAEPLSVTVRESAHSRDVEGYYTAYIRSGGADNDRPMTVRLKPSTGEWFLSNHVGFLPGIRVPADQNPWA